MDIIRYFIRVVKLENIGNIENFLFNSIKIILDSEIVIINCKVNMDERNYRVMEVYLGVIEKVFFFYLGYIIWW